MDYTRLVLRKEDILKPIAKKQQGKRTDISQKSVEANVQKQVAKIAKKYQDATVASGSEDKNSHFS